MKTLRVNVCEGIIYELKQLDISHRKMLGDSFMNIPLADLFITSRNLSSGCVINLDIEKAKILRGVMEERIQRLYSACMQLEAAIRCYVSYPYALDTIRSAHESTYILNAEEITSVQDLKRRISLISDFKEYLTDLIIEQA